MAIYFRMRLYTFVISHKPLKTLVHESSTHKQLSDQLATQGYADC